MISNFYTTLFSVYRMVWSGESSSEIASTSFLGNLQQVNSSVTKNIGDSITVSHTIFCSSDANIKVGDRITDNNAFFTVKQIFKYDIGDNEHLELFVEREEDYASI